MKGINVRKIAAVAGAGLLAVGAIAAADVVYGSTQLVDQNGQPTVKVYIGSTAAISDGVAAANIAAKIANEAYKSSTLTASVSGTPSCSVGSGVGGAGTCSIVESSKKVTLAVTVPGTVAGAHTFKTLISDYVDKTLENRNRTASEDIYNYATTDSDTSTVTSPLRGSSDVSDDAKKTLYRIGSAQFTGFSDYSIVDNQATATTYTEEQNFWVGTANDGVYYENSAQYRDVIVQRYSVVAYDMKFTGNDYGIPVCTGDLNTNASDDWTSCTTDSNSRTDRHRVKVKFLGSEWIISSLPDPSLTLASESAVINGGQIKLAKEAKYGIINVGQTLDAGTFKVRLSDISVAVGAANTHPAIIDILDANDNVVGQIQVDPATTYTFTESGTGNSVKIHVYKTAPGFTLNAKWAEMAIYTDEITLKDAGKYNLVSSSDVDKNFKVSLLWKNRDYSGGSSNTKADSLRQVVIWNTDGVDQKVKKDDVVNFIASKPTFKLTYNGLDLTDDDYRPVTYTGQSATTYRVATSAGDASCAGAATGDNSYQYAKLIEIRASGGNYLGGSHSNLLPSGIMVEKVFFDPVGLTWNASNGSQELDSLNGSWLNSTGSSVQSLASSSWKPKVLWKTSNKECYNYAAVSTTSITSTTTFSADSNAIAVEFAGDNSGAYGGIGFNFNPSSTAAGLFNGNIVLKEDAGKYGTASNTAVYTAVPFIANTTTYSTHRFRQQDSSTPYAYYMGIAKSTYQSYEPTIVTERGSKVLSVGTSDVSFKVAKKLGQAAFTFAAADASSTSGAEEYKMGVGESKVFGGVTVLVKAIDATAGSCSVLGPSGTPACTVDSASLRAVIQPNNAASVVVTEPYALTSKLVALDNEGAGAGVAILVGGPMVNTMTADALKDTTVNLQTDGPVVKEIGNKIVVAGYTAADTIIAADQFIAGVKRQ